VAEALWRNLVAGGAGAPDSVHLADYPASDPALRDPSLDEAMAAARSIVGLGRTIRVETKTKVRQPLSEAVVHYPGDQAALAALLDVVADELNVKEVLFAESAEEFGRWHAKPNFKVLGPRLGPRVKEIARVLGDDDGTVAGALARGDAAVVTIGDDEISLTTDDVDLSQEVKEGWGVASEGGVTVALDLELTDALRREGVARELVRLVQDARKAAGLDVSDRIQLGIEAGHPVTEALAAHREYIVGETLAVDLISGEVEGFRQDAAIDGEPVTVSLRKAGYASPSPS
jgi:isoleucyl-tRNA synthetase